MDVIYENVFIQSRLFFANFQVTPFLDSSSYLLFVLCTPTLTAVVTNSIKVRTVTKRHTNNDTRYNLPM